MPHDIRPRAHDAFPDSPDALHHAARNLLGVTLARRPLIDNHSAPFDYLAHAFFEGGRLLSHSPHAPRTPIDAVVWANRGGGKTFLAAAATALDMIFKPGVEIRLLAGSLEQSARMLAHLRRFFDRPALAPLVAGRITDRRLRLHNTSTAEILAQSESSVRGTRVQKLRCDEVELFKPELWEAAQLVTRSETLQLPDGRPILVEGAVDALSTMHRPYALMQRVIDEARLGSRTLFRWGVVDTLEPCAAERRCDPCILLPECGRRAKDPQRSGHVRVDDAVRLKQRVSLAAWESEMLCLRPQRNDSVLPEFDPRLHVVGDRAIDPKPEGLPVAGMDFGFRSPTVVLWGVVDRAGTLWILAERAVREVVLEDHARALLDGPGLPAIASPPAWVGIDPAGRQRNEQTALSPADALRRAGLSVRDRRLPTLEGLALVRARLSPASGQGPRLFVHARCKTLIESLAAYHFPEGRPDCLVPEKDGSDHAVDALRYLVQNLDRPFKSAHSTY